MVFRLRRNGLKRPAEPDTIIPNSSLLTPN